MGRPTKYSEEIADKICEAISTTSNGLVNICKSMGIAVSSVHLWLNDNKDFSDKYARAREEQADLLADEIIEIADDSSRDTKTIKGKDGKDIDVEDTEWTNRSRLRVDARKWKASKLQPKKYGDRIQNDVNFESVPILSFNPFANTADNSPK